MAASLAADSTPWPSFAVPAAEPAPAARILVVDDNEDNLLLLSALLEGQGYAVQTATTGQAALAAVAADPPACILLDVMLPDFDGHAVARRIKGDPPCPLSRSSSSPRSATCGTRSTGWSKAPTISSASPSTTPS